MKKIGWVVVLAVFLFGCGLFACGTAAERAEFLKHDTQYKNWDHLKFSWSGWKNPTPADAKKSDAQKWWGDPIKVPNP